MTVSTRSIESNGKMDLILAKFDVEGRRQWLASYGSVEKEWPRRLALDGDGNLIVVGEIIA
jgi:hypothetical protein